MPEFDDSDESEHGFVDPTMGMATGALVFVAVFLAISQPMHMSKPDKPPPRQLGITTEVKEPPT